jgi:hypothetical protein
MTNNFEQIRSLLKLEADYFYFIQIIQRKKEIPELGSNNRIIRSYMIDSIEKFDKCRDEIISMCEHFNARAYIHLNRRKWDRISLECLRHNAELIANGQHDAIKSSLETVIGRHNCEPKGGKTWIIDIDSLDEALQREIQICINTECDPTGNKVVANIPTRNGSHLITYPFNSQTFGTRYPEIEIHKDNPTNLYIP